MQTYKHLISGVLEHSFFLIKGSLGKGANGEEKYMFSVFHEASDILKKIWSFN